MGSIVVSWSVWKKKYLQVRKWLKKHNKTSKTSISLKGNVVLWKDWKDSINRVSKFKKANKGAKPKTVTVTIQDKPKPTTYDYIQFNQQSITYDSGYYKELACAPTSCCICLSKYGVVTNNNFQSKVRDLIINMKTNKAGTTPDNMITGLTKTFPKYDMVRIANNYTNIVKLLSENKQIVINILTDKNFGYSGKFGHYISIIGAKDNKVLVADPHGYNVGHPQPYWLAYSVVDNAIKNNHGYPLFVIIPK